MKLAIIGTGISGMVAARLLHRHADLTVFEANQYVGGHTNTIGVDDGSQTIPVDTGFIVFNERTYPNFSTLLDILGVATQPTSMSFSVRCDRTGLEYNGSSLNGLFCQRSNLLRRSFLRMTRDIIRFNRQGSQLRHSVLAETTVAEFVRKYRYSDEFVNHYLLPMGSSIWSCPTGVFQRFPIKFILDFYHNHGLLSIRNRPTWRVIRGGSHEYVKPLVAPYRQLIRTSCPVTQVSRHEDGVTLNHANGTEHFDEVIFACHADQALRLLSDPSPGEQRLLSEFPYTSSIATLHTDESLLPASRRAWAAWNYHIRSDTKDRASLTYNMNRLQDIRSERTYLVSLNSEDLIDPTRRIAQFTYSHPAFTIRRGEAQARHNEFIRHRRTSYCGAWWGAGFHEDGVNSALAVCRRFGIDDWRDEIQSAPSKPNRVAVVPSLAVQDHAVA